MKLNGFFAHLEDDILGKHLIPLRMVKNIRGASSLLRIV